MKALIRRAAALSLLAGLAACGGEDRADSTADQTAEPAPEELRPEFAAELGIDLDAMRRTPSGLYVLDVPGSEGEGLAARDGHIVTVHYSGWLPTGDKFDASVDRGEPLSFQLGRRDVIAGWEEGVRGMRIGGVRRLVIPPDLAYGARGFPPVIPPNAYLVFEVELLDIEM